MKPLISICIPTWNHAKDLSAMLKALTSLPSFTESNDVEIVISDNASTDNTGEVVSSFSDKYPGWIQYFRNEQNVLDDNFGLALKRGTGRFRKLSNDTLIYSDSGLRKMLETVREFSVVDNPPHLFFTNQIKAAERIECHSFDEFFTEVSFQSTWIGAFGVWDNDLAKIDDFSRKSKLMLSQVDSLLRLLEAKSESVVMNFVFAVSMPRPKKGGYSIAKVFGVNYFMILAEYVEKGLLSKSVFRSEKRRMLRGHLLPFYLTFTHSFTAKGYLSQLIRNYWSDPLYWFAMPFVGIASVVKMCDKPVRKISSLWNDFLRIAPHFLFWLNWKRHNRHNLTAPVNVFDIDRVSVGKGTYGGIEVYTYGAPEAKLMIGNFCSIGPHVRFMLSGEHKTDGVSTYPFKAYDPVAPECEDICRGPIIVGDDVWFGIGATVLSGVTIGQGAVIGAGAVVTKDVEPYAVIGGVPAKFIRYRVGEKMKTKLLTVDWSSMTPEKYREMSNTLGN